MEKKWGYIPYLAPRLGMKSFWRLHPVFRTSVGGGRGVGGHGSRRPLRIPPSDAVVLWQAKPVYTEFSQG